MEDNRAPDEAERRRQLYGGCDKSVKQTRLDDCLAKEYHVIATAWKRFRRNSGAQCHTIGQRITACLFILFELQILEIQKIKHGLT
jgi:hypothetical protein